MKNSEQLLALYDELIVDKYNKVNAEEKNVMQNWHDTYKNFIAHVQARTVELKNGKNLNYDESDTQFLDDLFILNNPISSTGSFPISHDDLKKILRNNEFLGSIENVMLQPSEKSWSVLRKVGQDVLKSIGCKDQKLRFNRLSAASTIKLIPIPAESSLEKLIKYLNINEIIDFTNIEKNWYAQNEYLTKEIHKIFKNKILDENDFTDEYWVNLFAWSLYNKKVNQSESNVGDTEANLNKGTEKMGSSLNRILFGAAGTGKTFHTINHALSIIEDKQLSELEKEDRTELKKRFDELKDQGRIEFVTFHQSFSYEDFVEGIRAESKKNEQNEDIIHYPIVSGVFKRLCDHTKKEQELVDFDEKTVTDESIQNALNQLIEKASTEEITLFTKTGAEFKLRTNQSGKLAARAVSGKGSTTSLSHPAIVRYLKDQTDEIIANKSYEWAIAKSLRSEVQYETSVDYHKPYILIIDEINRGNISRIFGELITLIEDSKRQGAEEELSVTLPYSKEEFSVPSNVYIIGTMNSSDRSLTGLDIALRRRFTFIEMPPKPDLLNDVVIEGLNIGKLLNIINQRIEVLLDRDHCIGHANFMSLKQQPTLENLAHIFKQKIIPQLQEYFFDDWSKINMVFFNNKMLLEDVDLNISKLFPSNFEQELGYSNEKKVWKINSEAFETIDAFIQILGL